MPKEGEGLRGPEKSGLMGEIGSFAGCCLQNRASFLSTRTSAGPCSRAAMSPSSSSRRSEGSPVLTAGSSFTTVRENGRREKRSANTTRPLINARGDPPMPLAREEG